GGIPGDQRVAVGNRWTGAKARIDLLSGSDVLLAVGTRFGATDTSQWTLPLPSAIIHVDVDPDELNRNVPAEVALQGDAQTVLSQLLHALDGRVSNGRPARQVTLDDLRQRLEDTAATSWPEPIQFLRDLRAGLARDAIVFCDNLIEFCSAHHFTVHYNWYM